MRTQFARFFKNVLFIREHLLIITISDVVLNRNVPVFGKWPIGGRRNMEEGGIYSEEGGIYSEEGGIYS